MAEMYLKRALDWLELQGEKYESKSEEERKELAAVSVYAACNRDFFICVCRTNGGNSGSWIYGLEWNCTGF